MPIGPIDALALSSRLCGRIVACDRRGVQVTLAMRPRIRLFLEFLSGMFDSGSPAIDSAPGHRWLTGDHRRRRLVVDRIDQAFVAVGSAAETPGD